MSSCPCYVFLPLLCLSALAMSSCPLLVFLAHRANHCPVNEELLHNQLESSHCLLLHTISSSYAKEVSTLWIQSITANHRHMSYSSDESISDDTQDVILVRESKKRRIGAQLQPAVATRPNHKHKHQVTGSLSTTIDAPQLQQWIDKYAPRSPEDICIHPRKLTDLKNKLQLMISGRGPKLLVVHGPSGSSKSTSVNQISKALFGRDQQFPVIEYNDCNSSSSTTSSSSFTEFLDECKYRVGSNMSVVLIEDFPNVFNDVVHVKFKTAIEEWLHSSGELPPLVICVTEIELPQEESDRSFYNIQYNINPDTLLGKKITSHRDVEMMKFNPIAVTYIKKTLNRVIKAEKGVFSGIPKGEVADFVAAMSQNGDIRSSISNLQFWSLMRRKQNQNQKQNQLLNDIFNKDTQLTLFHAIGKIVYGSDKSIGTEEYSSDYFTIEDVISNYSSGSLFQLCLLENYWIYNNPSFGLEEASSITNYLSEGDILTNLGHDGAKELGIRGTRLTLKACGPHKSSGGGLRIRFPAFFKIIREYNRIKNEVLDCQRYLKNEGVSFQDLNLIHGFYEPRIYNSFRYKYKNSVSASRMSYNRLGGAFKQIFPSEDLPIEEDGDYGGTGRTLHDQYRVEIRQKMDLEANNDFGSDDEGEMSDPIEDDDDDENNNNYNDNNNDSMSGSDADFLSDDELDNLIRERNL